MTVSVSRLDAALGLEYDITNHYTGKYFEEEIQGLAAASGVDVKVRTEFNILQVILYKFLLSESP